MADVENPVSEEVLVNDDGEIIENPPAAAEEDQDDAQASNEPVEESSEAEASADDDHPDDSAEELEAKRERRRLERQHKKQRVKEREDTLRSELAARDAAIAEMRSKLDAIERRNTSGEISQIRNAKEQASMSYVRFKEQARLAVEAADGAAHVDAIEKMRQAERKFEELDRIEKAYTTQANRPAPLDPVLKTHAEGWMSKNQWYDPQGKDEDSAIMLTIDQRMAAEGWNPKTPEYWNELTKRAQKFLPHRFKQSAPQRQQPRSVVAGSARESVPGGTQPGYRLSAERVQALKDAGMWNDPKKRAEMIKQFREYDKQSKG